MSTPHPEAKKAWWKTPKGIAIIVGVLALIGLIAGLLEEDDPETMTSSVTGTSAALATGEQTPAGEEDILKWQSSEDYQSVCLSSPDIDPEVQAAVSSVEIPDNGHVQFTNVNKDNDNPGMITVFFALCSPATGDDLREIAEDLAIEVRNSEIGASVSEMGVNASYANPRASENILRDSNFQMHLHDGGISRENGAFRGAWEAKN